MNIIKEIENFDKNIKVYQEKLDYWSKRFKKVALVPIVCLERKEIDNCLHGVNLYMNLLKNETEKKELLVTYFNEL